MQPTEELVDMSIQLGDVGDEFIALAAIAERSNRSLASVIRVALRNYIASRTEDTDSEV